MQVTKTVYSLYFPETRRVVDELWSERPHHLYERNYDKRQDAMHGPFLATWRRWAAAAGVLLGDGFVAEYPTAGATEGIQALMLRIATTTGRTPTVHVFDGEYEGFRVLAQAASIPTRVHARDLDPAALGTIIDTIADGDWFLISQPSAIDGSVWPGFAPFVRALQERRPAARLAVDLTYVGAVARDYSIDLTSENIAVVLVSLSKPFGIYYHRVGALLSRTPFDHLFGNLWFKNLFSIELGRRLMERFGPRELPARYASAQARAIADAIAAGAIADDAGPADVVLLAAHRLAPGAEPDRRFAEFVRAREPRGAVLRYCLSPAIDAMLSAEVDT